MSYEQCNHVCSFDLLCSSTIIYFHHWQLIVDRCNRTLHLKFPFPMLLDSSAVINSFVSLDQGNSPSCEWIMHPHTRWHWASCYHWTGFGTGDHHNNCGGFWCVPQSILKRCVHLSIQPLYPWTHLLLLHFTYQTDVPLLQSYSRGHHPSFHYTLHCLLYRGIGRKAVMQWNKWWVRPER
jgi:hypothetical protein